MPLLAFNAALAWAIGVSFSFTKEMYHGLDTDRLGRKNPLLFSRPNTVGQACSLGGGHQDFSARKISHWVHACHVTGRCHGMVELASHYQDVAPNHAFG